MGASHGVPGSLNDDGYNDFVTVNGGVAHTSAAALLAVLCVCVPGVDSANGVELPPNIVLVLTDDQGYADLGVHGNTVVRTPPIDAFAREAIVFSDFHVSPTCSPTRAAVLTGRDPNRTGVWHTAAGRGLMRRDEVTIAQVLREAGYATGLFGKWHLGGEYPFRPQDRGFEETFTFGGAGPSLEIPVGAEGRYVRVQHAREGAPTLAQVEVRGTAVEAAEAEGALPNIVLILADDLGLGDVRSYTNTAVAPVDSPVPTPAIDRLAVEGMRFTNAHSPSAVCSPTRYGLLTGRYAWRTRLTAGTVVMHAPSLIDPAEQTLPELLRDEGYATAMFGKWHLGLDWATKDGKVPARTGANVDYAQPFGGGPVHHGFDTYFGDDTINFPPFTYMQDDRVIGMPTEPVLKDEVLYGFRAEGYEFGDVLPETVGRSVDYIREQSTRDRPFFVYLSLTAPHAPIVPPALVPADAERGLSEFSRDDGQTLYSNFIRLVDWSVEQVLNALDAADIDGDTLVIFTSDNGASKSFASHDRISPGFVDGVLLRGQKADAFEGGHRVPLLLRWPGRIGEARVSSDLVELNDIYRTVADILGVEEPSAGGHDSISMARLLLGDAAPSDPRAPRTFGVNHSHRGGFAIREIDAQGHEWKVIFGGQAAGGFSGGAPFDPFATIGETFDFDSHLQLYDLTADPGESNDLLKDGVSEAERVLVLDLQSKLQAIIESGQSRVH